MFREKLRSIGYSGFPPQLQTLMLDGAESVIYLELFLDYIIHAGHATVT